MDDGEQAIYDESSASGKLVLPKVQDEMRQDVKVRLKKLCLSLFPVDYSPPSKIIPCQGYSPPDTLIILEK